MSINKSELLNILRRNKEYARGKIIEVCQQWSKGEIANVFLVGDYYKWRVLYYSYYLECEYGSGNDNKHIIRKKQASLDQLEEVNKIIISFGQNPIIVESE